MNGNELILLRKIEDLENYIKRVPEVGGVWQDWTPTITASGSMTISGVTINKARYCIIGKTCIFTIRASFTTGGTTSTTVYFSTPAQSESSYYAYAAVVGDTSAAAAYTFHFSTFSVGVRKADGTNWGLGASRYFVVSGSFEIA